MQTTMHVYCFDIRIQADRRAYTALCERLIAQGFKCFESAEPHYRKDLHRAPVTLTTFSGDHWDTAEGSRVFDWAQDHQPNSSLTIKRGYYLDQTPQMREARHHMG